MQDSNIFFQKKELNKKIKDFNQGVQKRILIKDFNTGC